MSVVSGQVKLTVDYRSTGDGPERAERMGRALGTLPGGAQRAASALGGLRSSLTAVAGVVDQSLGALARDLGDVGELAVGVTSKFGAWGAVITGVVVGIGALVAALVGGEPTLTSYGKAMETAAKRSGDMATAITQIASEARTAQGALAELGKTAMNAFASLQELRGDKEGAALTRSKLGAVEASSEAAAAEAAFVANAARLATADQIRKAAIDDITYAERDLLEAQLRHDEAAVALAAQRLFTSRLAKAEAESAVRDLTPLVQRMATTAGALRAASNEQQLQANMVPGVEFFTPDAETQKYVNKGGDPGEDPWDEADTAWEAKRQRFGASANRSGGMTRGGFAALERNIGAVAGRDDSAMGGMAADVRDFSAALAEALPGMGAFTSALSQISDIWSNWSEAANGTRKAVIGSIGAIAVAGAQQIKDERARAGVLAVIYLGLGLAHVMTPGMQAQGAGELAGAAVLATVGILGSSGRSGGRGRGPVSAARPVGGESMGAAPIVMNIQAPWFGPSPQEAMAGLWSMLQAVTPSGWGP